MFEIGWSEILVIGVVALIAIGPKELPGVLRSAGQWIGKIKRMAAEFQGQFQEAMREAEMADLKKHADDLNSMSKSLTSGLDPYDIMRDTAGETKPAATTVETPAVAHTEDGAAIPLDAPTVHEAPMVQAAENVPDPIAAGSPEAVHETSAHPAPPPEKSGT
jgi:sec-independent protein translocase protein TatB